MDSEAKEAHEALGHGLGDGVAWTARPLVSFEGRFVRPVEDENRVYVECDKTHKAVEEGANSRAGAAWRKRVSLYTMLVTEITQEDNDRQRAVG